ncbi:4-chloro-allylglycine synthase BesC [Streptantibioticus ferralitis]|uniref:Iron-containing redox enzyme family protein n=1 Tax=Streptantibioticus ferralitis TaxID=236510 RepID=A0ABT5YXF1_9ACTN|nr:4-chloro-allylglycine synthase BesC [Streptantibioticus ferralitis]MDF2255510.1 iron-containing redox enzyme family protein [Streptantibioticus ferralitis]
MTETNALHPATAAWDHFDNVETGVRRRIAVADPSVKAYLDGLLVRISEHRAVEHPLLNVYRTTPFDPRQERLFYSECHYFFRHLPFYITGMAMMTRDEMILREIVLNVADEIGTDPTHSTLFAGFLARLGIDQEHLDRYEPLEVTQQLNDGIRRLYTESSIYTALGALYADETMSSIMVSKINDGLHNQGYDEKTRHFWKLHVDVEVGHSNSVFNAIAPYVGSATTRQEFEEGSSEFLELVERYWDGVQQLVGVTT